MFQSLFWWNILLKDHYVSEGGAGYKVSILVLVEYPTEVVENILCWHDLLWFQSLFWWNILLNNTHPRNYGILHGCVSILVLVEYPTESVRGAIFSSDAKKFQSLFWWNILLNYA